MRYFYKHLPSKTTFLVSSESQIDKMSLIDMALVLKDTRSNNVRELIRKEIKLMLEMGKL